MISDKPRSLVVFTNNKGFLDTLENNYVISFQNAGLYTSSEDIKNKNEISIYPNPCENTVYVEIPNIESSMPTIKVFNISGKEEVVSLEFKQDQVIVNTSTLNNGLYFISIIDDLGRSFTSELVVKRN